ncbi:DUF7426 family protein [Amycolatopsis palatopharyngis]|uniref:DUF7426 family protein n=1 Tax=Amycolatopsis palatopharyngis TaxID=187982 RepID=UPI000E28428B|nr:hypothetical protein [Amycolatopsis palatopharyngis]
MAFKDLGDWYEIGGLKLPIRGKTYSLPPISAELGPRLQAVVAFGVDVSQGRKGELSDKDKVVLDDMEELDLFKDILHPCNEDDAECDPLPEGRCSRDVYQEMTDDGVPWNALKLAAMTSMFDAVFDRQTAEKYWESLGKAPAPNRAGRRSKATEPASKTKKASAAGTTSRKATARKGTGGRKSSKSGT